MNLNVCKFSRIAKVLWKIPCSYRNLTENISPTDRHRKWGGDKIKPGLCMRNCKRANITTDRTKLNEPSSQLFFVAIQFWEFVVSQACSSRIQTHGIWIWLLSTPTGLRSLNTNCRKTANITAYHDEPRRSVAWKHARINNIGHLFMNPNSGLQYISLIWSWGKKDNSSFK